MKSRIILLLCLVVFNSCKKNKEEKAKVEKPKVQNDEPKININGLVYHTKWDGVINEGEYEEVYGEYAVNRYNNPKKAISLDGLSEYTKIENHDVLNTKKEITISIWYKPIAFKGTGNNPLIIKSSGNSEDALIQYSINVTGNEHPSPKVRGSFRFSLSIDGKYNSISTKPNIWSPEQWYNITGVYDGKYMKLFVNGKAQNNRLVKGELNAFESDLYIGKDETNKFFTPGTYDDLRIYNRALTAREILTLSE